MKKSSIIFLISIFPTIAFSQWAGSTNNSTVVTPNKQETSVEKRYNVGIGIGGITKSKCVSTGLSLDLRSSGAKIITDPSPRGFNFFYNSSRKTEFDRFRAGFEFGFSYSGKTIEYEINGDEDVYEIGWIHTGIGIPVQYNFIQSKYLDVYGQATVGYGLIAEFNDDGPRGTFYGGGAIGARWTAFFAEIGLNTTGYFRCGMTLLP